MRHRYINSVEMPNCFPSIADKKKIEIYSPPFLFSCRATPGKHLWVLAREIETQATHYCAFQFLLYFSYNRLFLSNKQRGGEKRRTSKRLKKLFFLISIICNLLENGVGESIKEGKQTNKTSKCSTCGMERPPGRGCRPLCWLPGHDAEPQ